MTGRVVTYRTTYRPKIPSSWPDTTPPLRRSFPANTNRPPAAPPRPASSSIGRRAYFGPSAVGTAAGAFAAHQMVNALSGQIMDYWARTYTKGDVSQIAISTNVDGKTVITPAIDVVGTTTPADVVTGINYNSPATVVVPVNPALEASFYFPPPQEAVGSFQKRWFKKFTLKKPATDPTPEEIPWLFPQEVVRPMVAPRSQPYNRPREEPLPETVVPGVLFETIGIDVYPEGPPVVVDNPRVRPPPKIPERKITGVGVAVLAYVSREMGEGVEWLEVLTDGFGFQEHRHKFFTDPIYADIASGGRKTTEHWRRAQFLLGNYGTFDWKRFFRSLAKKVAEDVIAGTVLRRAVEGARQLGVDVNYKISAPLS